MVTTYEKGITAEFRAKQFFKSNGFKILASRYRTPFGEIDLIVQKKQVLHFVEVKERSTLFQARAAILSRQMNRISKTALCFIQSFPEYEKKCCDFQFDALFVVNHQIYFLEQAWTLE